MLCLRYLKECKLPDQMALLEEDVEAVVSKKADDVSSGEETDDDDQESLKDESNGAVKKTWDTSCSFPLELGTLRVLTLGTTNAPLTRSQLGPLASRMLDIVAFENSFLCPELSHFGGIV